MSNVSEDLDIELTLKAGWGNFTDQAVPMIVGLLLVGLVGAFTLGICVAPMLVGYNRMLLRIARGEKVEIGDVFDGFSQFVPSLLMLLIIAGIALVSLLVIIGPIIVAWAFFWSFWIMADGEDDFMACLKGSWEFQKENIGPSIIFALVASVVQAIGNVVPFGGLISSPVSQGMIAHGYNRAFKGAAAAELSAPAGDSEFVATPG